MTGNSKKKNDGRPDDFPLDITCGSVGEGGDQEAAAGLPGSAPPPENNVRPGTGPKRGSTSHLATRPDAPSDRSADSESDGSGTARAGDINRRGSDRDSGRDRDGASDDSSPASDDSTDVVSFEAAFDEELAGEYGDLGPDAPRRSGGGGGGRGRGRGRR